MTTNGKSVRTRRATTLRSTARRSTAAHAVRRAAAAALLAAVAVAGAAGGTAGCQGPATSLGPTPDQLATGVERVPVRPAWRAFAEDQFRGVVMAELRAQRDARFATDPDIAAARRLDGGGFELTAVGDVDVNDGRGNRLRRTYFVLWRQRGGGWDDGTARIDAGKASPEPPLGAPAPTGGGGQTPRPATPAVPAPAPGAPVPATPGAAAPPA